MSASGTRQFGEGSIPAKAVRSPLATLLHALNQPLTGLQCSMEVALASPRTPEQYVQGLREGLELSERMRALVETMREVLDAEEEQEEEAEMTELKTALRDVLDDLAPVGEVKHIRVRFDCPLASLTMKTRRRGLNTAIFRLLESALSLAVRGSVMQVEAGETPEKIWIRLRWQAQPQASAFSRPELGFMVAQAGFERCGAEWERDRSENKETLMVQLPRMAESDRPV